MRHTTTTTSAYGPAWKPTSASSALACRPSSDRSCTSSVNRSTLNSARARNLARGLTIHATRAGRGLAPDQLSPAKKSSWRSMHKSAERRRRWEGNHCTIYRKITGGAETMMWSWCTTPALTPNVSAGINMAFDGMNSCLRAWKEEAMMSLLLSAFEDEV